MVFSFKFHLNIEYWRIQGTKTKLICYKRWQCDCVGEHNRNMLQLITIHIVIVLGVLFFWKTKCKKDDHNNKMNKKNKTFVSCFAKEWCVCSVVVRCVRVRAGEWFVFGLSVSVVYCLCLFLFGLGFYSSAVRQLCCVVLCVCFCVGICELWYFCVISLVFSCVKTYIKVTDFYWMHFIQTIAQKCVQKGNDFCVKLKCYFEWGGRALLAICSGTNSFCMNAIECYGLKMHWRSRWLTFGIIPVGMQEEFAERRRGKRLKWQRRQKVLFAKSLILC